MRGVEVKRDEGKREEDDGGRKERREKKDRWMERTREGRDCVKKKCEGGRE